MNRQLIPAINQMFVQLYKLQPQAIPAEQEFFSASVSQLSVEAFGSYLIKAGSRQHLLYLQSVIAPTDLKAVLQQSTSPLLIFRQQASAVIPVIVNRLGKKRFEIISFESERPRHKEVKSLAELVASCYIIPEADAPGTPVITCLVQEPALAGKATTTANPNSGPEINLSPMRRFLLFLAPERKEIWHMYIYAAIAGIISLSLPLGIQSIIGFISAGQVSASVVVLISFIVIGVLITGGLQMMQVWLVEHLQQRMFSRLAFDFANRLPQWNLENLKDQRPTELMNRFFETVSLQKGVAKILLEFNAAILQILFGLILLSLYHSSFIFFGILLTAILGLLIWLTSAKGISTSLYESKYKYQMADWLQSMARTLGSFKLAGHTTLGMQKTDYFVSNYILARRQHFKVLVTQYFGFVLFKTVITASLLILGCVLVVNQEINIGQFVAAEIIIILIMSSVEKIILKLDVVYDVLTALEKISAITSVPLEETTGITLDNLSGTKGLSIQVTNLEYSWPQTSTSSLKRVSFNINASEKICLAGYDGSGKTTLLHVLLGMLPNYQGSIAYNGLSLRDLDITSLRSHTSALIASDQLVSGTILQNIIFGTAGITQGDVSKALAITNLTDYIHALPQGLHTPVTNFALQFPRSICAKIVLARALVTKPNLLILDDYLLPIDRTEKIRIYNTLLRELTCTIILVSNDLAVMQTCDRVLLLKDGTLVTQGSYTQLEHDHQFQLLTGVVA